MHGCYTQQGCPDTIEYIQNNMILLQNICPVIKIVIQFTLIEHTPNIQIHNSIFKIKKNEQKS